MTTSTDTQQEKVVGRGCVSTRCVVCRGRQDARTFLMLLAYCFIAIFSTVLSKPKKDLMSRLALCSKQVHSSFSGWTCGNTPTPVTACKQSDSACVCVCAP